MTDTKENTDCPHCGAPSMENRTKEIMKAYRDGIFRAHDAVIETFDLLDNETSFGGVV
jgi:hypothetical protein